MEKQLIYSKRSVSQILQLNEAKYFCFPTNTYLNKQGNVFLFGKCYNYTKNIFPDVMQIYSEMLKNHNQSVDIMKICGYNIFLSFPTRSHWKYNTNMKIVMRSVCELYALTLDKRLIDGLKIYLPLQIDGYPEFQLQDLIAYTYDILIKIPNLEIILI